MKRLALLTLLLSPGTHAGGFGDLLQQGSRMLGRQAPTTVSALPAGEIDAGLREALSVAAERAVAELGRPGGFLNDPKVHIGLPGSLNTIAQGLRAAGQGERVDQFEQAMNRAAEKAIPKTLDIVKNTVAGMTLDDARGILSGGDTAATDFLRRKAGAELEKAIAPIVAEATDQAGATRAYKALMQNAGGGMLGGLLGGNALDLDRYVTDKTLDGLFTMLAEEEKKIRTNPMARSTELLKKVFGR